MPLPELVRNDPYDPKNPAEFAPYPAGLALDLALKTAPVEEILLAYNLTKAEFVKIAANPTFKREYQELVEMAKEEGFSFRMKARAQAEGMLKRSWELVHNEKTPANVVADLIKWTAKVADLEPNPKQQATPVEQLGNLAEQLKNMPATELEMKVLSIVMRNTAQQQPEQTGITYDAAT